MVMIIRMLPGGISTRPPPWPVMARILIREAVAIREGKKPKKKAT